MISLVFGIDFLIFLSQEYDHCKIRSFTQNRFYIRGIKVYILEKCALFINIV